MLPQADAVSPDCPGEEGLARLGRAFLTAAMGLCAFAVVPPALEPVGERPGRMGESGGPRPAVPWRPVLSQSPARVSKRPGPVPGWAKGGLRRERPGPRPRIEERIDTRAERNSAGD